MYIIKASLLAILPIALFACAHPPVCKDGNPVPPPVDCHAVYPSYARAYSGELSMDLQVAQTKLTNLKLSASSDVKKLREDYDQISNQLEMNLKANCVALNFSPCDAENRSALGKQSTEISKQMGDIRAKSIELKNVVNAIPNNPSDDQKLHLTNQVKKIATETQELVKGKP